MDAREAYTALEQSRLSKATTEFERAVIVALYDLHARLGAIELREHDDWIQRATHPEGE